MAAVRKKMIRKQPSKRLAARQRKIAKLIRKHGSIAQFARDLSKLRGQDVSWERVYQWTLRDSIPKDMARHVHKLTGVPLIDLL